MCKITYAGSRSFSGIYVSEFGPQPKVGVSYIELKWATARKYIAKTEKSPVCRKPIQLHLLIFNWRTYIWKHHMLLNNLYD